MRSLQARPFVATESRLHTAVELLRQIVQGTDPERRLTDLKRRRDEIDAEIPPSKIDWGWVCDRIAR